MDHVVHATATPREVQCYADGQYQPRRLRRFTTSDTPSECGGDDEKHGDRPEHEYVGVLTAKIVIDDMRDEMHKRARRSARKHRQPRIAPPHRQQQGHTDADLERADVMQQMPVVRRKPAPAVS